MVLVDTSAWIEFFREGSPETVEKVDRYLEKDLVGIGDLILCEVMQGIRSPKDRRIVSTLFHCLPQFEMVGFEIAEKSASNYRLLRSRGVTIRKTIDVLIGTYCAEQGHALIHYDSDFERMARHIGLDVL